MQDKRAGNLKNIMSFSTLFLYIPGNHYTPLFFKATLLETLVILEKRKLICCCWKEHTTI